MRIASPAHSSLLIDQTPHKTPVLLCFSLPREVICLPDWNASAAMSLASRGPAAMIAALRIIIPPLATRIAKTATNRDRPFSTYVPMLAPNMVFCFAMPTT